MSRSDHDSSVHLTSPSHSRPASKGHSMNHGHASHAKPTNIAALNILLLGETNIGENSIIDLISGPVEQNGTPPRADCYPSGDDMRSVTLDGRKLMLYALPTRVDVDAAAPTGEIQERLAFLRENGGVHLLVYCMNANGLHPTKWIHEIHRTITSDFILPLRTPAIAVVTGVSEVDERESWWSNVEDALADQGPQFDDHTFILTTTADDQPLTGDHISESRHALRELILQNIGSDAELDDQRAAFYRQRSIGNSFQSLLVLLARKPPSHAFVGSKPIDVVLLGEIGVGKSSLVNLITRANVAKVSSDTIGCTRTASRYTVKEKGRVFHLYDTPGLVDPQMGDKPFLDPIDTIQKLIRNLGNGNGPDLVLFCVDNSKPTTAFKRNYHIFHKYICSSKVPFALVVTKLGGGQGADQWWRQHGSLIRRYGIDRSRYIGLGCDKRHPSGDAEGRLRESLLSFFVACTDRQKNGTLALRSSMERVAFFLRSRASTPERTLMKQCGLEERTARELVHRIMSSKNKSVDSYATR